MSGKSRRTIGQLVRCTKCGELKSWQVGVFKSEKGKPRMPCIECDAKRRAAWTTANPGRERRTATKRMARWRAANPEKVREANRKPRSFDRKLAKERINRWRREHPEARKIEVQKRKARKQGLPAAFGKAEWERCLTYWGECCCICGRVSGRGFVIAMEHWIALSDPRECNPGTVPWNILPMCHARNGASGGCNNDKWAKDPVEWLAVYLGAEKAQEKLREIEAFFSVVTPNEDDFAAVH